MNEHALFKRLKFFKTAVRHIQNGEQKDAKNTKSIGVNSHIVGLGT